MKMGTSTKVDEIVLNLLQKARVLAAEKEISNMSEVTEEIKKVVNSNGNLDTLRNFIDYLANCDISPRGYRILSGIVLELKQEYGV